MKADIHPQLQPTTFNCACGSSFIALAVTGGQVRLDICAKCHPFFTGKQKLVDTAGRIEKFKTRYEQQKAAKAPQPKKSLPKPKQSPGQAARKKMEIPILSKPAVKKPSVRLIQKSAIKQEKDSPAPAKTGKATPAAVPNKPAASAPQLPESTT